MKELWFAFEKDKHSLYAISNSDYVNTTGKGLQDVFLRYNKNVKTFPNMFNWRLPQWNLWDMQKENKEKYKDKIVIGYCGLSSHQDDIRKLSRIWKQIHDKYPNTYFICSGIVKVDILYNLKKNPDGSIAAEEQKIIDPKLTYRARMENYFSDFDPARIELQDSLNLEDWGQFYTQYDINCVFVEHNTFNRCKCLVAGTKVATSEGILDIDKILSNKILTDKDENIIANIKYENEKCVKLITENGYELEGTISHRIKNVSDEWVHLDELEINDIINLSPFEIKQTKYQYMKYPMLLSKYNGIDVEEDLENGEFKCLDLDSIPHIKLNEKWGMLLGIIMGDGNCCNSGGFGISCNSRDNAYIQFIKELALSLGIKPKIKVSKEGNCTTIKFCSKTLKRILIKYKFYEIIEQKKNEIKKLEIPEIIFNSPRSVISSFLKGLFEADAGISDDGSKITYTSKSKKLAQNVQYILLGFGIKSKLRERFNSKYNKYYYEVYLSKKSSFIYKQEIGFISDFKKERMDKNDGVMLSNNSNDWNWSEKIIGKIYTFNDVYDIEVENTHEYNSNGFISHNSPIKVVEGLHYENIPMMSYWGPYKELYDSIPSDLKNPNIISNSESEKEWVSKLEYWVNNLSEGKIYSKKLRGFTDNAYDIDKHILERLEYYNHLMEQHDESEVLRISKFKLAS